MVEPRDSRVSGSILSPEAESRLSRNAGTGRYFVQIALLPRSTMRWNE